MRERADTNANGVPPNGIHAKSTMSNLIKQLAAAQMKMVAVTNEMKATDFEGSAGGGLVKVTISGAHEPKGVVVHPDVLKEDAETVQELMLAALKAAHLNVENTLKAKTAGLTKSLNPLGLQMPGM